eukprot:479927-Ditylum_brightwellii.AAC.1
MPKITGSQQQSHMIPTTLISHALMCARALPPNACAARALEGKMQIQTIAITFTTHQEVELQDTILPEFDKIKRVDRDFLQHAVITLNFQHGYIEWLGQRIAMKATIGGVSTMMVDEHTFFVMREQKRMMMLLILK